MIKWKDLKEHKPELHKPIFVIDEKQNILLVHFLGVEENYKIAQKFFKYFAEINYPNETL